jgi:hypothetical protein
MVQDIEYKGTKDVILGCSEIVWKRNPFGYLYGTKEVPKIRGNLANQLLF